MSFIDSKNVEETFTNIPMIFIEYVLEEYGYEITKTRLQLTASYGGTFSTNGHFSVVTIIDDNGRKHCKDVETVKGLLLSPVQGRLSKIIQEAEKLYSLSQDKDFQEKLIKQCDYLLKKYNHYQEKSENVSFLKKKSLKKETQKIYDEYISYKKLYNLFQKANKENDVWK